ncbi:DUF262 domain-containing protein [Ethanoligenens sp.]|uniref:GmrSD restriction endonuclease domain-containing protein n=1 Tax=Ethanoligenens sp. TaxID=2099655 RepID=UPI0039EBB095
MIVNYKFIYGKTEGDKFIPLDGQQRLTTLFLIHLYAFANDESKTNLLNRFTYETRASSREFLKKLVEHRASLFSSNIRPSDEISDSDWYQSEWDNDPTVQSVKMVLDDIVSILSGIDNLCEKLSNCEDEPVKFSFLPMDELGMEDSIYIRMNARGRMLTPFENYKAQLISRVQRLWEDKELCIKPHDFERCMDGKWTDLFWTRRRDDFDTAFKNFFDILFTNFANLTERWGYVSSVEVKEVTAQMIEAAYYTLNYFCADGGKTEVWYLVSNCLGTPPSFIQRVLFFAVSEYMLQAKGDIQPSLYQWVRIICNLTNNTNEQIGRTENFRAAIQAIAALVPHWNNLLEYFANNAIDMKTFSPAQIDEERIKANLILRNPDFAEKILSAEKHGYFNGQLRSALALAEITYEVANKEEEKGLKEKMLVFDMYWSRISALFTSKEPVFGVLMRCALLSYRDYTLRTGSYHSFGVDNPSDPVGLKALFADSSKTDLIRELVDAFPSAQKDDIKCSLQETVSNADIPETDWRYCFVKYPKLFEYMSRQYMRIYKGANTLIVKKIATNGRNYEVFTCTLRCVLESKNKPCEYDCGLGNYGDHYVTTTVNGKSIVIKFDHNRFMVYDANIDKNKAEAILFQTKEKPLSEIVSYLEYNP